VRRRLVDGHDPVAFIPSSNVNRRHLNAGQRAMAGVLAEKFKIEQFGRLGGRACRRPVVRAVH